MVGSKLFVLTEFHCICFTECWANLYVTHIGSTFMPDLNLRHASRDSPSLSLKVKSHKYLKSYWNNEFRLKLNPFLILFKFKARTYMLNKSKKNYECYQYFMKDCIFYTCMVVCFYCSDDELAIAILLVSKSKLILIQFHGGNI
jgi:hypothetical protein